MALKTDSKRAQVDKDKTTTFALIAAASIIFVISLMVAKGFWSQGSYLSRVVDKKEAALDQLESNKAAISQLSESYETLVEQSPNLLGGTPDGTGERDGNNATLILDALPNRYDFPALASSLEKILSAYTIDSISGVDESVAQQKAGASEPVEIPFQASVKTSYDGFKSMINAFDNSIRPFSLTKIELSGANSNLKIDIGGKSFYQPDLGLQITKKEVQ